MINAVLLILAVTFWLAGVTLVALIVWAWGQTNNERYETWQRLK